MADVTEPFPFLSLPRELPNHIYSIFINEPDAIPFEFIHPTSLFATASQSFQAVYPSEIASLAHHALAYSCRQILTEYHDQCVLTGHPVYHAWMFANPPPTGPAVLWPFGQEPERPANVENVRVYLSTATVMHQFNRFWTKEVKYNCFSKTQRRYTGHHVKYPAGRLEYDASIVDDESMRQWRRLFSPRKRIDRDWYHTHIAHMNATLLKAFINIFPHIERLDIRLASQSSMGESAGHETSTPPNWWSWKPYTLEAAIRRDFADQSWTWTELRVYVNGELPEGDWYRCDDGIYIAVCGGSPHRGWRRDEPVSQSIRRKSLEKDFVWSLRDYLMVSVRKRLMDLKGRWLSTSQDMTC